MSGTALEKVHSEALNLSEAERAELAYNLVVSLGGPPDPDVEKAWDAEEPCLARTHGEQWRDYARRVPRWLWQSRRD